MAFSLQNEADAYFDNSGGGGIWYGGTGSNSGPIASIGPTFGHGRNGGDLGRPTWVRDSPPPEPKKDVKAPENPYMWDIGQGEIWKGPPHKLFDWYL